MKFDGGHFAEHGKLYYCTHKNSLPPALADKGRRADIADSTQREGRTCKSTQARNLAPVPRHGQAAISRLRRYALTAAFWRRSVSGRRARPGPAAGRHRGQAGGARDRRGRRFVGRFEAVDEVAIRSRVAGYLDEVHFKDGALVKKDDLLFTIDQRPYQAAYDAAKSQIDVWNSLLEFSKAQLERAEELAKTGNLAASIVDDRRRENLSNQAQIQGATAALKTASLEPRIHRDQGAACPAASTAGWCRSATSSSRIPPC